MEEGWKEVRKERKIEGRRESEGQREMMDISKKGRRKKAKRKKQIQD